MCLSLRARFAVYPPVPRSNLCLCKHWKSSKLNFRACASRVAVTMFAQDTTNAVATAIGKSRAMDKTLGDIVSSSSRNFLRHFAQIASRGRHQHQQPTTPSVLNNSTTTSSPPLQPQAVVFKGRRRRRDDNNDPK